MGMRWAAAIHLTLAETRANKSRLSKHKWKNYFVMFQMGFFYDMKESAVCFNLQSLYLGVLWSVESDRFCDVTV